MADAFLDLVKLVALVVDGVLVGDVGVDDVVVVVVVVGTVN